MVTALSSYTCYSSVQEAELNASETIKKHKVTGKGIEIIYSQSNTLDKHYLLK